MKSIIIIFILSSVLYATNPPQATTTTTAAYQALVQKYKSDQAIIAKMTEEKLGPECWVPAVYADPEGNRKLKGVVAHCKDVRRQLIEANELYSKERLDNLLKKIKDMSFADTLASEWPDAEDYSENARMVILSSLWQRARTDQNCVALFGDFLNKYLSQTGNHLMESRKTKEPDWISLRKNSFDVLVKNPETMALDLYLNQMPQPRNPLDALVPRLSLIVRGRLIGKIAQTKFATAKDLEVFYDKIAATSPEPHKEVSLRMRVLEKYALSDDFNPPDKDEYFKLLDRSGLKTFVATKPDMKLLYKTRYIVRNKLSAEEANKAMDVFFHDIDDNYAQWFPKIIAAEKEFRKAGLQTTAKYAAFLTNHMPDDLGCELEVFVEPNEPLALACGPNQFIGGIKRSLREANGRDSDVQAIVDKVCENKGTFQLKPSIRSKAFGEALVSAGGNDWRTLMFQSKFLEAAQYAYKKCHQANENNYILIHEKTVVPRDELEKLQFKADAEQRQKDRVINNGIYKTWAARLKTSIVCLDQCYNGRALETMKWLNDEIKECPLPELLK